MQEIPEKNLLREKKIIRTSIIGIVANVILSVVKAVIGLISSSIAIVMDSVNNITDATSSVITIIGARYARKKPDRKHPNGHGRAEYITAAIISVIVLYAGFTSLVESVKGIISPSTPDYSIVKVIILAATVGVKIFLSRYYIFTGRQVNSDALVTSGKDAGMDAVISSATIVAALLFMFFGISVEPYLALIISVLILKTGYEMISETLSKILGEPVSFEKAQEIKDVINSFPDVRGTYDLILNDYGPDEYWGSVHIELDENMTVSQIDTLTREITAKVYGSTGVILTGISVYASNTGDTKAHEIQERIYRLSFETEHVTEAHGFYLNEEEGYIQYDIVVSFDAEDREKVLNTVLKKVQAVYPQYEIRIIMDAEHVSI